MVMNVWKEKIEGYQAEFKTSHGIISFLLANLLEGYILVTYINEIFGFWLNLFSSLPSWAINYMAYTFFSISTTVIYLTFLYILIKMFKSFKIKNRKIF